MSDAVWVRGYYGEQYVLVDGNEVLEMRTEAEARRFLEELGEKALDAVDPRALPPGLRSDFEAAGSSREDQLAVLAQMLSSGQFSVVRLQRPFRRLDPVKSVPLSSLRRPEVDEPPAPTKVKEVFAYEVRLVDELGEPIADVPVSLSVSGTPRRLVTDADGQVKVDDGTTGTTVLQFTDSAALQVVLKPRWEQPRHGEWLAEDEDHTYVEFATPLPAVQVRANRLHTIVMQPQVTQPRAVVFDTGGLCFGTDRETFVPTRIDSGLDRLNHHFLTGIDALHHVVEYAQAHPEQKACVVGHTDTVGNDTSNLELSKRRAQTVELFLAGDRESWATLAVQNQTVADWQVFLQWAHLVMGMNCHPGEVDNDLGKTTQGAMHRFRETYNTRYEGELAVEGPFVAEDWKAAFDCYRKNLAEQLGQPPEALEATLAAVQFGDPRTLGCGEAFPAEHVGVDGRDSARNRRVDIVFYDVDDPPDFEAEPPGAAIYGEDGCKRTYGRIEPSAFAMVRFCLQDALGAPQAGFVCSLMLDGRISEAVSGPDGYVEFRVPAQARSVSLLVHGAGSPGQERHVVLGGLQAVDDDTGVEGRLRNLGFDTGPNIGQQPQTMAGALSGFQSRCSLEPTGIPDDDTRDRLAREHGC